MYPIEGTQKAYDWGSTTAIQQFADVDAKCGPLAEVWFGAHKSGPSRLGSGQTLDQLLAENPNFLGESVRERYGELPFLMKLLAPGRAVSLQVHPCRERAKQEFAKEREAGVLGRFSDPNHKPEMIYALTPFEGLVGLRHFDDAIKVLRTHAHPELDLAADAAEAVSDLGPAIARLASLPSLIVLEIVDSVKQSGAPLHQAYVTLLELAAQYPGNAGVLVALVLSRVSLQPGEAVFVPSGVPHAYMSGLAVEIMANSDNVFRLGLTTKMVDVDEVLLNLNPDPPVVISSASSFAQHVLQTSAEEFVLTVFRGANEPFIVDDQGPKIALVTEGTAKFRAEDGTTVMRRRGEALFIPSERQVHVLSDGVVVMGSVPITKTGQV